MSKITSYFSPAKSVEDTIPAEWRTNPLPRKTPVSKRPVGRPRKTVPDIVCIDDESQDDAMYVERADLGEATPKRGKYKRYTVQEKQDILSQAELIGVNAAAKRFHLATSTICTWKKKLAGEDSLKRKKGSGEVLAYSKESEEVILAWIHEQRDQQLPVSRECIKRKALDVITPQVPSFKASNGWLTKFMKRNSLSNRTPTSFAQKLPADLETRLFTFYRHLRERRQLNQYDDTMVINMDEVPMVYEEVSTKTVDVKGRKEVKLKTAGGEKRHFTAVLSVAASGHVLPTLVIFKGKRQPDVALPLGWHVVVNETAWMREDVMLLWVERILRPYTERRPSLLVMDSFTAHTTDMVNQALREANCTPAIIPGGCTSKAQPLDVALNKPFKDRIRRQWIEHTRKSGPRHSQMPSKDQLISWMESALRYLEEKEGIIAKSFKVTGISTALSGEEDGLVRDEGVLSELTSGHDDDDDFVGFTASDVEDGDDPFWDM